MNKITNLKYSDVDFIWVNEHYDKHLSGLCKYNNEVCFFKTNYEISIVSIYKLNFKEKIKWKLKQKIFEFCVGYHWTYPRINYRLRKPYWFWRILFKLYYW